jgi:hypothetical protein
MKTNLAKLIKNSKLAFGLGIAVSVLLVVALVPTLLLPRFRHWQSLQEENQADAQKLAAITANIATLATADKNKISEFKTLMSKLLPDEEDPLRVLAILDQIIKDCGLALDNFQIKTSAAGATRKIPSSTPTQQTTTPSTLGATTTQPPTVAAPRLASSFQISATLYGNLSSVLALIERLDLVKRAIEVSTVSLSKSSSAEAATVNITFVLPLGQKTTATSAQTKVELAASDNEALEKLIDKLTIDAVPSASPLGQPEPFGR